MAIPILLYFALFCYLPMSGLVIAFKRYSVAQDFFTGVYFGRVIKNTLLISFYNLIFGFPAPIIFALLINELKGQKFKKLVQTITYLPHFISLVVICGIITNFFSTNGVVTQLISLFGGENMNYIGSANHFRTIYVITDIWQGIGWSSIIYLAALSGIDAELYEAASIDGAGKMRKIWHITIPGIMSTVIILLIMRIGQLLSVGHEKIILLYGPATYETADVISSFIYRRGLQEANQYSFSAAVGMFSSVINLIVLFVANKFSRKVSETSLF